MMGAHWQTDWAVKHMKLSENPVGGLAQGGMESWKINMRVKVFGKKDMHYCYNNFKPTILCNSQMKIPTHFEVFLFLEHLH